MTFVRLVILLLLPLASFCADDLNHLDRLSIHFENDLFVSTDRFYTNGLQIRWLSRDLETVELPDWALRTKRAVGLLSRAGYTHNVGMAIGQNIFTPEDILVNPADANDHPYAGWLYGSLSLHHKNPREVHTLELTLGVVGPEAFGEDAQNGVHELRDLDKAEGWDAELDTEPGIILTYQQKRRFSWRPDNLFSWGFDSIPDMSVSVGNISTRATLGNTIRFGWNLPRDFHGTRIRAAGSAPLAEREHPDNSRWSLYAFAGIEGQGVAHNIFLDGNTFSDGPSVDRKEWVAEGSAGIGFRWRTVTMTWTQVFRTREFTGQSSGQQFGSFTLSVDY